MKILLAVDGSEAGLTAVEEAARTPWPEGSSVIAYGTFEEVSSEETRENVLTKLYSKLPHMTPVESRLVKGMTGTIVFRIEVEEMTGIAEEW